MKEKVIRIINRKINYLLSKKEEAKRNCDIISLGLYHKTIETLIEVIQEIQSAL